MNNLIYQVVAFGDSEPDFEQRLRSLRQDASQRYEKLVGICARLRFVDHVYALSSLGDNLTERQLFNYQVDRLATYLATTCIDIVTGKKYQPYNQWLEQEREFLSKRWTSIHSALSASHSIMTTAKIFIDHTNALYSRYMEQMSIRRAFRCFIGNSQPWLKAWLLTVYIVEKVGIGLSPKLSWNEMSDEQKCRSIAHYLYDVRNMYTHTVKAYQPLNMIQRTAAIDANVQGQVAVLFPSFDGDVRVSLPVEYRESDVIRLLVLAWIREHWLNVKDNETFIQKYWQARKS